jgi:hypothetical protein
LARPFAPFRWGSSVTQRFVVSILVIADLTQGSGRFSVTLGAIAAAALGILYFFMPETRDETFLSEHL